VSLYRADFEACLGSDFIEEFGLLLLAILL